MSVQTQIDRISGAVSAALAALAEKGVTVPAGTKVDGLAALIAAIESGGGSGGGSYEIYTGDFTVAEDTAIPTNQGSTLSFIDTGREDTPYLYAYWLYGDYPGSYGFTAMLAVNANEYNYYKIATANHTSSISKYSGGGYSFSSGSMAIDYQAIVASSTTVKLYAGSTYKWLALYNGG